MRCNVCFKDKDTLVPVRIKERAIERKVCKGCFYEIDKIRGWLEMNGVTLDLSLDSDKSSLKDPPSPPKK